jgi:hypothetical protein
MRRINGNNGPRFRPADNTRVGKLGAASGWMAVRSRLKGNGEHPMLFVFSTVTQLPAVAPPLVISKPVIQFVRLLTPASVADAVAFATLPELALT